ncbi:PQQ-dependent sugar dehydrogenase [Christiangramia forsetii]|uniref:L-sorbosone dehydrogenase n=2 Tax=Christiangramia forsetii TaxID=411153 RepID=A0M4U8_CHRFK|nr:sorbosone dehydrogenase family protein [Christiangramia forsetii]GGG22595.1 sorbosone dehydrogenase [Christiangramia forsetii]CAL67643.1 L-sorbosone dehydrogenase [Christiangramia forsetii KT0803]
MKNLTTSATFLVAVLFAMNVAGQANENLSEEKKSELAESGSDYAETAIGKIELPAPFASESVRKESKIVAWPEGKMPEAPEGFKVTKFAEDLEHPRWTYVAPNNDIFVVETDDAKKSANRITMFRDKDQDGVPDESYSFLKNLNQPFGMLIMDGYFYVANVDQLIRFPYKTGQNSIDENPEKVLDLPAGGYNHHWTRNIIAGPNNDKIYITVGSSSNVGEHGMEKEERRANIIEINPNGTGEKIFAAGLRNPVGIDWNPVTGELWTAVNERDKIGNNLVPDYVTSVQEGGWYGWPYSYYGDIKDPRWAEDPHLEMVEKSIVPDVSVGPHTASLGFTFYKETAFPEKYHNGAFVGQHGSWNRANFSGYKVLFIPFDEKGNPQQPEDFLTGFIADDDASQVYGRPVGVTTLPDGSLLVNDDDGGVIWRVSAE